jgi:transcriptional regulator with GAF, ATPase, and Fis domain
MAVLLSLSHSQFSILHFPFSIFSVSPRPSLHLSASALAPTYTIVEKSIVERALRKADGRVGEAARLLGVTDHTIRRIISKLLPAL